MIVITQAHIWVTSQFIAIHKWEKAPTDVNWLRHPHRHVFKVKALFGVSHSDRQLEFFQVKRDLDAEVAKFENAEGTSSWTNSCEDFANTIISCLLDKGYTSLISVEVSEDGENGAVVEVIGDEN